MAVWLAVLALTLPAAAQDKIIDDSDLGAGPRPFAAFQLESEGRHEGGRLVFPTSGALRPRSRFHPALPPVVSGRVVLPGPDGKDAPGRRATVVLLDAGGNPAASTATGADGSFVLVPREGAEGAASVRLRLANRRWSVENAGGEPYEWVLGTVELPLQGPAALGSVGPDPGSENATIGWIHLQFNEALDLFEKEKTGLRWWGKTLGVRYPGRGDFFSPWSFQLNLTDPKAWDVNLHELGHAVMAAGTRSHGGGGQHYIDRCYNAGLAWSEGWATFFAGAVRLARNDPDARMEHLVPRRAPVRIENVPEDVCRGDTNEWRVASGLWDLYDVHEDGGDAFSMRFARIWKALAGKRLGGFPDAWKFIGGAIAAPKRAAASAALVQNTLLKGPPAVLAAPRRPLKAYSRPSFDGR